MLNLTGVSRFISLKPQQTAKKIINAKDLSSFSTSIAGKVNFHLAAVYLIQKLLYGQFITLPKLHKSNRRQLTQRRNQCFESRGAFCQNQPDQKCHPYR